MRVLVAIKRVIDFAAHIRVKQDGTGVETAHVKLSVNPFDEIALEEAVRLKEKGIASEVIAVSIGTSQCNETLRTALAMGADRAILIETDQTIEPLAAAKILQKMVERESPHLVILGKQAIDTDNNQTGQMLAGLLNWSQGTFISKLEVFPDNVRVTREIDGGLQTLKLTLPAVITTDLRLNVPRYLSLPNIMAAKKKPIAVLPVKDLSVDIAPRLEMIAMREPEKRRAGIRVKNVQELVDKLRHEAKIFV